MTFQMIVVSAYLPSQSPINLGVLILDESSDRLHFRFRTDFRVIDDPLDREVIQGLPGMIESMVLENGALGLLKYLEDIASNAIRVGERSTIQAASGSEALDLAFREHIV